MLIYVSLLFAILLLEISCTMDNITIKDLQLNYPKTWEQVNQFGSRYYQHPNRIKIRSFLDHQGYSLSFLTANNGTKYIPVINYKNIVDEGNDRKFWTDDFEPMSWKKMLEIQITYSLWDYEKNCYLR
jgi:hypothetical protein